MQEIEGYVHGCKTNARWRRLSPKPWANIAITVATATALTLIAGSLLPAPDGWGSVAQLAVSMTQGVLITVVCHMACLGS
jgi:hypothetical protein